ncbi:MAG: thioredoxin family protein [Nitrososphaerales archaeon]
MKIELLYFSDCPSWENAFVNLRDAAALEGLTTPIELVEVLNDEDAARRQFLGSPSILVDGRDLWPESRNAYYMSCRMYPTPDGIRGWPTREMIRKQLRALASRVP